MPAKAISSQEELSELLDTNSSFVGLMRAEESEVLELFQLIQMSNHISPHFLHRDLCWKDGVELRPKLQVLI